MAAHRRVYDLRHLQADYKKNRDQLRNPTLGNQVWATFTFTQLLCPAKDSRDTHGRGCGGDRRRLVVRRDDA